MKSVLINLLRACNYSIIIFLLGHLSAIVLLIKLGFNAVSSPYSRRQVYLETTRLKPKATEDWHRQVQHQGCLYFMLGMMLVVIGFALVLLIDGVSR